MIEARNIVKSYGDLHVLKGIDIIIPKGEIVAILGKSGAGKSTLLHILGTLDKADQGQLIIDGQEIQNLKSKDLSQFRNSKIGFVFQFHHLLSEFTALENVCIPALIGRVKKTEAEKKARKLLHYLGLQQRIRHKPAQMSGGEQQRVAIARALINDPKVIFADEPTGNLDSETSKDLHQLFLKLSNELGHTFVLVTHNDDLANLCHKRFYMENGKISKTF
jgi:lipoprotein-releasing system ATP-binding protein